MPLYGFGPARNLLVEEALDEASRRERERVAAELDRLRAMPFNMRPKGGEPMLPNYRLEGFNPSGYRTPALENDARPNHDTRGPVGGPEEPPLPEGLEFVDTPPAQASEEVPPLPEGLEEVFPAPGTINPRQWQSYMDARGNDPLRPKDWKPSQDDFARWRDFVLRDPLAPAPPGFETNADRTPAARATPERPKINLSSTFGWEFEQPEWMEDAARLLEQGSDSLIAMVRDPTGTGKSDIVREAANMFTTGATSLLPQLFRDPTEVVSAVDPFHQAGRASNAFGKGITDLARGDLESAKSEAAQFLTEGSGAALSLFGFKAAPGAARSTVGDALGTIDRMLPGGAGRAVDRAARPVLERDADTLAGVLTDQPVRPQALDVIVRVLRRSDIPLDRIAAGLGRVVDLAKETARRPATVAQLLQREFGPEFPQVVDHINTVLRARGLSKKKGDASPTIVRETTQAMRGSQPAFIEDSAKRNLGAGPRIATLDDARQNMEILGKEAYEPILKQRIDDNRAERIVGVLLGPHMEELTKPLRQIAAGEGKNLDNMIVNEPLRAAHWMQHKARLKAEEAEAAGNGTLANAYGNMRGRILAEIDDLKHPDAQYTYRMAREEFGDEVGREIALNFGDRFLTVAMDDFGSDLLKRKLKDLSPAEKQAAMLSVRDAIIRSAVRQARPGGGANLSLLGRQGALHQLENIFGDAGKAMADDIRALVGDIDPSTGLPVKAGQLGENEFLQAISNYRGSQTQPNLTAAAEEAGLIGSDFASSIPATLAGDAALMMSGLSQAPLFTLVRHGPQFLKDAFMPRTKTREDMTRVLLARQQPDGVFNVEGTPPRQVGPPAGGGGGSGAGGGGPRNPVTAEERAFLMGEFDDMPEVEYTAVVNKDGTVSRVPLSVYNASKRNRPTMFGEGTREPEEPRRLRTFLRSIGGLKDDGGEIMNFADVGGGKKRVDAILNNKWGMHPDEARVKAWEEGYFPGNEPPDIDEFINAVSDDYADAAPRYRLQDSQQLQEWKDWRDSQARLERTQNEIPFPDDPADELGLFGFGGRHSASRGFVAGAVGGAAVPTDFDGDGEVTITDRLIGMIAGGNLGGLAGHVSRKQRPGMDGVDRQALGDWGVDEKLPWVKRMSEEGFSPREIQLAQRFMMERFSAKPLEKIAEALQLPVDSLRAKIGDMQRRLTEAGIGVDLNNAKISPDGAPPAGKPRVTAEQVPPKDLIIGYNDGDSALGIGLDLDLPENARIANVIYNRQNSLRREAREAIAAGRVEPLAREWGVTPDEIEKFVAKRQVGEQTVEKLVSLAEKAVKAGRRPDPVRMAQATSLTPGSVKTILSQVKNGTRKVSDELKARVEAVAFKRGRPRYEEALETPPELGGAAVGGLTGGTFAVDADGDGEVSAEERALSIFAGAGAGAVVGNRARGLTIDRNKTGALGGSLSERDPRLDELMQTFDEDASTDTLRKIQQAAVKAGKIPPVFKTFRMPDGRIIAWDGQKFSHAEAREILELGDQRLEHGQFKWGDDLAQTSWYETSGSGPRPRSLESMMKKGQAEGREPGDVLLDATPEELMRDLRSIGAVGPGKTMQDYPYRRQMALDDVVDTGDTKSWETRSGRHADLTIGSVNPSGAPLIGFEIDGMRSKPQGHSAPMGISESKETFEKAFAVLEREMIRKGKDAYLFHGSTPAHNRFYLGALQRLGAPQGYVAVVAPDLGNFGFLRAGHFNNLVAEGRIKPKDWLIITSKRGDKEVPAWRRETGMFAFPAAAAGGAALYGFPENENPRR